jgi:serine/threonine protein phosphatase 1
VAAAEFRPNRINLDTGAFRTGKLSAVRIDGTGKRLLTVTREGVAQSSAVVTP